MKRKSLYLKFLAVLLCMTLLIGCAANSASQKETESQTAVTEQLGSNSVEVESTIVDLSKLVTYDEDDYYSDWKNENPNYVELTGTGASINGSGAEAKEGNISITAAGVYVFSGKLDDGQIIVDVQDKGTVRLVFNGVEINSSDNAPIYVKNAGKAIITLQEGTENSISDGTTYVFSGASTDEPNAAIFSKDSLIINGGGKLTVHGNYKDGITGKDDLKITGGNIQIYSVDDGLTGRDMVVVKEGSISIEAGGDGIKATNDEDTSKGFIALEGGSFDIISGTDGIQAETSLLINDGAYTITTGGGSVNGSVKVEDRGKGPLGNTNVTDETEEASAKALKASANISINGGTFNIDSADDSIHSNNNVAVTGGDISITSGDDGIHADTSISIAGGEINIAKSYEGIESTVVTVSAGKIHVIASDDGINISGGNDGSAMNGRQGQNNFSASNDNRLNISGGYIVVDAAADGLDANGSIYMSGGTVLVNGPTTNNNGALDYDGNFEITGGFIIAAGSSGMAQAASEQSTQYSVLMTYSQIQQAGTTVYVTDRDGNKVAAFAPQKDYQAVFISSPELKKDSTYTLYSGGTSTGAGTDGLYSEGEIKGGTKIVEFTISDSVTWLSETGVTTGRSSNMGRPGKPGFGGDQKDMTKQ